MTPSRLFALDDFEDFKLLIKENLGRTLDVEVERDGAAQTLSLKIPKAIPKKALYTP